MKNTLLFLTTTFVLCLSLLKLTGCNSLQSNDSLQNTHPLLVERQHFRLEKFMEDDSNYFECVVDVPVQGPEPLYDSVMSFLDTELQVWTKQVSGAHNLNLFLIAQTESFVSYGLERYQCGTDCKSELLCYSFCKTDGHRIHPIVSDKDHQCFLKNLCNEKKCSEQQFSTDSHQKIGAALAEKGLLIILNDHGNFYSAEVLDYKDAIPYLTEEAQKLVKTMGDSTQNNWKEYFVGERIGSVNTDDGKTIILTQTPSVYGWSGNFPDFGLYAWSDNEPNDSNARQLPLLKAFYTERNHAAPAPVINGESVVDSPWDELFTTNPTENVFAFDPTDNTLYIPSFENDKMKKRVCHDLFDVYEFDGQRFVLRGQEGGFWLHPTLREYSRLCYMGESENYLVRVDELRINDGRCDKQHGADTDTGRYRFAVWKSKHNMWETPDIVIDNGYYSKAKDGYIFQEHGYLYIIDCRNEQITVLQNGKTITQISVPNSVIRWGDQ